MGFFIKIAFMIIIFTITLFMLMMTVIVSMIGEQKPKSDGHDGRNKSKFYTDPSNWRRR